MIAVGLRACGYFVVPHPAITDTVPRRVYATDDDECNRGTLAPDEQCLSQVRISFLHV